MGCAGSTELVNVDPEALRAHIARLSTLTKMPYLSIKTYDQPATDKLRMEVNGIDAAAIGPELLKLLQGYFTDAHVHNMATIHAKGPPYKQDYGIEWTSRRVKGSRYGLQHATVLHQLIGMLDDAVGIRALDLLETLGYDLVSHSTALTNSFEFGACVAIFKRVSTSTATVVPKVTSSGGME